MGIPEDGESGRGLGSWQRIFSNKCGEGPFLVSMTFISNVWVLNLDRYKLVNFTKVLTHQYFWRCPEEQKQ